MRFALCLAVFSTLLGAACSTEIDSPSRGNQGAGASGADGGHAGRGTGGGTSSGGNAGAGVAGSGAGMSSGGTAGAAGGTAGAAGSAPTGDLKTRLTTSDVTTPEGAKPGGSNWRIWRSVSLAVARVYTAPLANCGTLVCYTTQSGSTVTARAARLGPDDRLVAMHVLGAGLECRGIAAEPDGHFAALLWNDATDQIFVKRFDVSANPGWSTELANVDNHPDDFGLGEGRMAFGNGKYGAYYHVHSDSGHEGDTLKWVNAASGTESTEWAWGCSHSMSNLLTYNPTTTAFLPACVTDCYPGTSGDFAANSKGGIYLNNKRKVIDVDAGCNGKVAAELGSAALSANGWKLVFNAHKNPMTLGQASYNAATMNQDIGFSSVASDLSAGAVVWLTDTPANEADSSIARWKPAGDDSEQYVVGWLEPGTPAAYKLARVDAAGAFVEQAVDVSAIARWGQRDDPFREHYNADVVWAWFDGAGSTTLHFARLRSGGSYTCAAF